MYPLYCRQLIAFAVAVVDINVAHHDDPPALSVVMLSSFSIPMSLQSPGETSY